VRVGGAPSACASIAVTHRAHQEAPMTHLRKCLVTFGLLACAAAMPGSRRKLGRVVGVGEPDHLGRQPVGLGAEIERQLGRQHRVVPKATTRSSQSHRWPSGPGMLRMKPAGAGHRPRRPRPSSSSTFRRPRVRQAQLAQGQVVSGAATPLRFRIRQARKHSGAFFLVLTDDWYRELQTNAVVL